jgi:uncharacterized membrane protein YphA (DoxX/SURF4 family)
MALVRMAVGVMFLFFAEYKLASPGFAHGGYAKYVGNYLDTSAVSFYQPFLRLTLQHPVISGYAVATAELLIGLAMVLGYQVRIFSVMGALFMLNLLLCTWNAPGPGAYWRYLGNEIDNLGMFFLFVLFFAHRAGDVWGLDARSPMRSARVRAA